MKIISYTYRKVKRNTLTRLVGGRRGGILLASWARARWAEVSKRGVSGRDVNSKVGWEVSTSSSTFKSLARLFSSASGSKKEWKKMGKNKKDKQYCRLILQNNIPFLVYLICRTIYGYCNI